MKICLQSDQYSNVRSGIGIHTNLMVDGMLKAGHEVILLCNEKERPGGRDFTYEYVPSWSWDPNHAQWFSFAVNTYRRMGRIYRKHKFDIFHCLDAREGSLAVKKLPVPGVGSINDYYFATASSNPIPFHREYRVDWLRRYLNYNFIKYFERFTLNNFDRIIANSEITKMHVSRSYRIPDEKICRIHKAVPYLPKKRNRIRERARGDYIVLMVGIGLQRKGIFHLIRASPGIIRMFPNVRFSIVGKVHGKITRECRKLGVMKNFQFHGILNPREVHRLYEESDVFILPSLIEGFGVSLVEAMSHGLPSVGADVGGIKDIIKSGRNGILIPPRDSQSISEAVAGLLKNRGMREGLSREAFRTVRESFNSEALLRETLKVYDALL